MRTKQLLVLATTIATCLAASQVQAFEFCQFGRRLGIGWSDGYNARVCCHAYGQQWSAAPIEYAAAPCVQSAPIHHGQPPHLHAAPIQQPMPHPQPQPTPAAGWFGGPQPTPALPSSQATPMNFDQPSNASIWRRSMSR